MPIQLGPPWGGILPKLNADQLPEGAASKAENVDVSSGALILSPTRTLTAMFDGTNALTQDIPDADLTGPAKPDAPTRVTPVMKALPANVTNPWLTVTAKAWAHYYDADGDLQQEGDPASWTLTFDSTDLQYTKTGFKITIALSTGSLDLNGDPGTVYTISGPRFQIGLVDDSTQTPSHAYGGPDDDYTFPATLGPTDPLIPAFEAPLFWSNGSADPIQYGSITLRDISCPVFDNTITLGSTPINYDLVGGDVTLTFDLNYEEPRQTSHLFRIAKVESDKEGPYSEASELFYVRPGEVLEIDLPSTLTTNEAWRIYKTLPNSGDYYWMGDIENGDTPEDSWTDTGQPALSQGLPATGPLTSSLTLEAGIKMHPAGFAVGFPDSSNILYRSEIGRPHIMPGENTIEFTQPGEDGADDAIFQTAIIGSTIIVWTASAVHAIGGNDPANASYQTLTRTAPALSKLGIVQIGPVCYWVCSEGLAATTGSSVEIMTTRHFTQADWNDSTKGWSSLSAVKAYANGAAVLLTNGTKYMRIDLTEEPTRQITTLTGTSSPTPGTYTTQTFRFPRPVFIDYVRATFSGSGTMTCQAVNPTTTGSAVALTSGKFIPLGVTTAGDAWTFTFVISGTIQLSRCEAYERQVVEMSGASLTLTPENTPVLEDVWVKFPKPDRICAALAVDTDTTAASKSINIYSRGGTSLFDPATGIDLSGGTVVSLDRRGTSSALTTASEMVRVRLTSSADGTTPLLNRIESLTLFTRQTRAVSQTLRIVNSGGVPEWLYTKYEFEGEVRLMGVSVYAGADSITMRYWANGAGGAATSVTGIDASDDMPIRLSTQPVVSSIELDFNGNDHLITEVILHVKQVRGLGDGPLRLTDPSQWVGNVYRFPDRGTWAAMSVGCNGSTTVKLYADGVGTAVYSNTSTTQTCRFLSRSLAEASLWEIEVTANEPPDHLLLYPRDRVSVQGNVLHLTARDTDVMPWAYGRFEFDGEFEPSSYKVVADSYSQTMNLYADGATSATKSATVASREEKYLHTGDGLAAETAFTAMSRLSALDLDFGGTNDYKVNEVILYGKHIEHVGDGGVFIQSPPFRMRHCKFPSANQFAAGIVHASVDVTLTLIVAGVIVHTESVTAGTAFRLPRTLAAASEVVVDVACTDTLGEIYSIQLVPRQRVAAGREVRAVRDENGIPEWWYRTYELLEGVNLTSGYVKAKGADYTNLTTLNLYGDDATSSPTAITPLTSEEFSCSDLGRASCLNFDFGGTYDALATEVILLPQRVLAVDNNGLIIRRGEGDLAWKNMLVQFPEAGSFSVARVVMRDYTGASLILTPESGSGQTLSPTTSDDIELSTSLPWVRSWLVSLTHAGDVDEIHLIGRQRHRIRNNVLTIRRGDGPFSWLAHEWLAESRWRPTCMRVIASDYGTATTVKLWDAAGTLLTSTPLSATSRAPFRIPPYVMERQGRISIYPPAGVIIEEVSMASAMPKLGS